MKSLIVEDDVTSRALLQELLAPYGLAHSAVNGEEGIVLFHKALEREQPYDLVCLDILMPEMDGQQVLKQLRALEEERGILSTHGAKIVMVTGLDDVKSITSAFKGLCDGYLVKPLSKKLLLAKLRELSLIS
ncbi:MAG: response regulator [Desulfuromonadaceae bacterium]|nr:response regulator [Desulfuromonadaceae bacterium]